MIYLKLIPQKTGHPLFLGPLTGFVIRRRRIVLEWVTHRFFLPTNNYGHIVYANIEYREMHVISHIDMAEETFFDRALVEIHSFDMFKTILDGYKL